MPNRRNAHAPQSRRARRLTPHERGPMNTPTPEREQLVADIKHAGFYPDLVLEVVDEALADMNPDAHFVQHETHFSRDDFHRHITVMVMSGDYNVFAHLDDQHLQADPKATVPNLSLDAVHLSDLNAVTMSYGFSQPQAYNAGNTAPTEISFQIAWTGSLHLELAPAGCQDPQCNADHGYTGDARREDIAVRVSATADGPESVYRAQHFARALHRARMRAARR